MYGRRNGNELLWIEINSERDGLIIYGASLASAYGDDNFVSEGTRQLDCCDIIVGVIYTVVLNKTIGAISIYCDGACYLITKERVKNIVTRFGQAGEKYYFKLKTRQKTINDVEAEK